MKPFLLVNAGSGGGSVQGSVLAVARDLGVSHHVVEAGEDFDDVLSAAVSDGADVLAAAGGDGTLSAVADVAMTHDLPLIVVPAGTRNHFALDLGLDLTDPADLLRRAVSRGHERRVDVGTVNGVTFLNNVSLGAYASAVTDPDYRGHKTKVLLQAAKDAMAAEEGTLANLTVAVPGSAVIDTGAGAAAVLAANNAYAPTFAPGKRLRPRMDAGEVWLYIAGGLEEHTSLFAGLIAGMESALKGSALRAAFGAERIRIDSDVSAIPVAIDGEERPDVTAPLVLASRKQGLRLIVPDDPRPSDVKVVLSW